LSCRIIVEAFYYDITLWKANFIKKDDGQAILFKRNDSEVLAGTVQADSGKYCGMNAEKAFMCFGDFLADVRFPVNSIIRQWNYIENILGFDGERQRYQEFNEVRSAFYAENFSETGYPAATGIGMDRGGVLIEFLAVNSREAITKPLDNPYQVAAHNYSSNVLVGGKFSVKSSPKFERARYLELFGKKLVFISGTASIRGENTLGAGDPAEQTRITIDNIRSLYSPDILQKITDNELRPKYGHARVYLKNRSDFEIIKKTYKRNFGNLPVVYLVADICRDELLVEIEGKVIFE
jgi:hypothetical protein